jgi:hypothetical protein
MANVSGRNALSQIDDALTRARQNLSGIDTDYGDARNQLARLRQSELNVYANLARLRLLAIEQGDLLNTLGDADREAADILEERQRAAAALDAEIESEQTELAAIEQQRGEQQAIVAAADDALDTAEAKAQAALSADQAYKAQLRQSEQADFVADQAEEKAAAAKRDRVEKGKPYEADPLFLYLWERGYGTSKYRAWPLTRLLDGWVARICKYEQARRNYALLTEIPLRLEEHAASMRADFDAEAEKLAALEQAAAEAAGVPALKTRLEDAEKTLDTIDARIEAQEEKLHGLVEQRKTFGSGTDTYYQRCLEVLSKAMQRQSVRLLQERAERTRDRDDDELVRRLIGLGREADRLEQNLDGFRRLHESESARVRQLEEVRRRFKSQRYDDPRSEFLNGALIALVLRQFLNGAINSRDLWNTIERHQRTRRVHADPNFGSLRFPRGRGGPWRMPPGGFGGGFGRGGGFGGGGFRTGGGFGGGGGFRTGGGF